MPAATWADVPSGRDVGQPDDGRRDRHRRPRGGGRPPGSRGSRPPRRAARRCRSDRAPRPAAGRGRARSAGRRRPRTGRRASRRSPGGRNGRPRRARAPAPRAARPAAAAPERPGAHVGRRVRVGARRPPATRQRAGNGSGRGVVALEPDERGLVVGPFGDALQPAVEEPHHLVELVEARARACAVRPGRGPSCRRSTARGRAALCIRRAGSTYESIQPPTLKVGGLDRVVVGGQRSLSPVRAIVSAGGATRTARSASPRAGRATRRARPSPRNAGSGGIAFIATWLTAYWLSSLAVTQPPTVVDVVR